MLATGCNTADDILNAAHRSEVKGRSLWRDAMGRFARNRAAVISLFVLGLILIFAFFGQFLSSHDPAFVDFMLRGNIKELGGPSIENGHYFGLEKEGRDLYQRTVQGIRVSIMIGVIGSLVSVVVGTLYGAIAGYFGGRVDSIMMRIVDILMAIPFMFVIILLLVIFGRSVFMLFVGIGLISWLNMARIARGQTLTIKNKEFVEAAIASGVKPFTIIVRHIVPNLAGVVIVYATLLIPELIIIESFISFLGLGIQEPMTSLGALINDGASQLNRGTPWMIAFPLFFFLATLYAFFFVGDGLRDALDPKDR
ncbi:peptide ABC transporter permease [Marivivens niveibacter]|uniref:Oligopeptide transport system permease protein OppC n=1 Tax=Marivivens niveibacter TaxID=1930667 RepID=A0A251X016_9RHOB|nr:ABC transporter permease subunit [Marivivens niveibacter]OUD10037.1 peptide ABC transporter permease [Marivivens niveibacter]